MRQSTPLQTNSNFWGELYSPFPMPHPSQQLRLLSTLTPMCFGHLTPLNVYPTFSDLTTPPISSVAVCDVLPLKWYYFIARVCVRRWIIVFRRKIFVVETDVKITSLLIWSTQLCGLLLWFFSLMCNVVFNLVIVILDVLSRVRKRQIIIVFLAAW